MAKHIACVPGVAPPAGAWIETICGEHDASLRMVAPPRGGVDRNSTTSRIASDKEVAPPAGAWIETITGLRPGN